MKFGKTASVLLVAAIATAFATPSFAGTHSKHGVKCMGVNACKGKAMCNSSSNQCKGQNACKGKGWVKMKSEKQCTDKGGTVLKDGQ